MSTTQEMILPPPLKTSWAAFVADEKRRLASEASFMEELERQLRSDPSLLINFVVEELDWSWREKWTPRLVEKLNSNQLRPLTSGPSVSIPTPRELTPRELIDEYKSWEARTQQELITQFLILWAEEPDISMSVATWLRYFTRLRNQRAREAESKANYRHANHFELLGQRQRDDSSPSSRINSFLLECDPRFPN